MIINEDIVGTFNAVKFNEVKYDLFSAEIISGYFLYIKSEFIKGDKNIGK